MTVVYVQEDREKVVLLQRIRRLSLVSQSLGVFDEQGARVKRELQEAHAEYNDRFEAHAQQPHRR